MEDYLKDKILFIFSLICKVFKYFLCKPFTWLYEIYVIIKRKEQKLAFVTQTTLSVDETKEIVSALTKKFPKIIQPKKQDICYATQNRQDAVKFMAPQVQVVIVVGSQTSSNSNRLRELAEKLGVPAYMVDSPDQLKPEWFIDKKRIGLTAGASAPESLAQAIISRIQEFGPRNIRSLDGVVEDVTFSLPKNLTHPA